MPRAQNNPDTATPATGDEKVADVKTADVKAAEAPTVEQLQRALDEERTQREHIAQELVEERTRREHIEREHERLRDEFRARWDEREWAFDAALRTAASTATTARPPKPRKRIATASFRVTHRGSELEVRAHDELPADLEVGELPAWAWREE